MLPVLNSWASQRNLGTLFYMTALSIVLSGSVSLSKGWGTQAGSQTLPQTGLNE